MQKAGFPRPFFRPSLALFELALFGAGLVARWQLVMFALSHRSVSLAIVDQYAGAPPPRCPPPLLLPHGWP